MWKQYRMQLLQRQRVLAREEQLKQIRQRFEEADSFYGDIRRLRHDMKNHMTNIKGLVACEQYEDVEHYIEKLDYSIEKLDCKFSTGNAVCDVVLGDKYKRAVKEGIRMEVDFFYKEDCSIAAFDMGIILANLLDNAIEACCRLPSQKRFIRLHMKMRDRFVFIEVENPFAGEIRIDEKNQLPVTTKYEEGEPAPYLAEHGIGLRNVREIAQQYLGGIRIDAEEQIFRITVMLQQNAG
ncbi:MAG: GHKL domain-containing protein [Lachnospiraceae bacterium]|nr:GHKL domain-containing protein [Lachnospiraceae bacterium]